MECVLDLAGVCASMKRLKKEREEDKKKWEREINKIIEKRDRQNKGRKRSNGNLKQNI